MLAADRMLLETNLRQRAIQLREKELNLFTENFTSVGTQAAVMAGFTTTCFIEITLPEDVNFYAKFLLHCCAIFTICSNIVCVSLSTIVSVWGSGKALRGKDGSMDEAVDGMNDERELIFRAFDMGLAGNLMTVVCASYIIMDIEMAIVATLVIGFTAYFIMSNVKRIRKKFHLDECVHLKDLTANYSKMHTAGGSENSLTYRAASMAV